MDSKIVAAIITVVGAIVIYLIKRAVFNPLDKHESDLYADTGKIGRIDKKLDDLNNKTSGFGETLAILLDRGSRIDESASRRELSNLGIDLATNSGIDPLIEDNWQDASQKLQGLAGYVLFEKCQELAMEILNNPKNQASVDKIKGYFYDKGVAVELAGRVFAFRLRDKIEPPDLSKDKNT